MNFWEFVGNAIFGGSGIGKMQMGCVERIKAVSKLTKQFKEYDDKKLIAIAKSSNLNKKLASYAVLKNRHGEEKADYMTEDY